MDIAILFDGTDITHQVISVSTEQNICNAIGTIQISVHGKSSTTFTPGKSIILYLNSTKVGTYSCFKVVKSLETINLMAQNESYKLQNYFISDLYQINYPSLTRYWIEKFLTEAGITYSFTTDSQGTLLQNDSSIGMAMLGDVLDPLLQQSGWYLFYDENNNVVIGELTKDPENSKGTITNPLNISTQLDDKMLRNRGIVWGKSNPYTGQWVFAFKDRKTGYETWDGDVRSIVLANGNIWNSKDAALVASQLVNEFSKPTLVTTISIPGTSKYKLGDTLYLDSYEVTKYCLVTNVQHSVAKDGFITTLTLDQRCPRIIAFFSSIYVYVGTEGSGVWRKSFAYPDGWHDYSNGIPTIDKVITDLKIYDGTFACVGGKKLYYRTSSTAWALYNPISFTDGIDTTTNFICAGCVIDKLTENIIAVYSDTALNKSWIVEITSAGVLISKKYITTTDDEQLRVFDVDMFAGKPVITATIPGDGGYFPYTGPDRRNNSMVSNWGQYTTINDLSPYFSIGGIIDAVYKDSSMFFKSSHTLICYSNYLTGSYTYYSQTYANQIDRIHPLGDTQAIVTFLPTVNSIHIVDVKTGMDTVVLTISEGVLSKINTTYMTKDNKVHIIYTVRETSDITSVYDYKLMTWDLMTNTPSLPVILLRGSGLGISFLSPSSSFWSAEYENFVVLNLEQTNGVPSFLTVFSDGSYVFKRYRDGVGFDYNPVGGLPYEYNTPFESSLQLAPDYKNEITYKISYAVISSTLTYRISRITKTLDVTTIYEGTTLYKLIWSKKAVYALDIVANKLYSFPDMALAWDLGETLNIIYTIDDRKNALIVTKGDNKIYWYFLDTHLIQQIPNVTSSDDITDVNGQMYTEPAEAGTRYSFPAFQLATGGEYVTTIKSGEKYRVVDHTPGPTILENSQDAPIVCYPLNWNDYRMQGLALSGMSGLAPTTTLVTNFRLSFYGTSGTFYSPTSSGAFDGLTASGFGAAIAFIDDVRTFYTTPPDQADSTTFSGISDNEWIGITQSGLLKTNDINFSGAWGTGSEGLPNSINHIEAGNFELAYFASTSGINPQFYEKDYYSAYEWTLAPSGIPSGYAINIIRVDDLL